MADETVLILDLAAILLIAGVLWRVEILHEQLRRKLTMPKPGKPAELLPTPKPEPTDPPPPPEPKDP